MSISFNSLVKNQSLHKNAQFRCIWRPCNHYLPSPVYLFHSTARRNLHFKNLETFSFPFFSLSIGLGDWSTEQRPSARCIISLCLPTKLILMGEHSGGLWGWTTPPLTAHPLSDTEQVGHSLACHRVSQHSGPQLPQFPWVHLTWSVSRPLSLFPQLGGFDPDLHQSGSNWETL